jgi:hypothetical protein
MISAHLAVDANGCSLLGVCSAAVVARVALWRIKRVAELADRAQGTPGTRYVVPRCAGGGQSPSHRFVSRDSNVRPQPGDVDHVSLRCGPVFGHDRHVHNCQAHTQRVRILNRDHRFRISGSETGCNGIDVEWDSHRICRHLRSELGNKRIRQLHQPVLRTKRQRLELRVTCWEAIDGNCVPPCGVAIRGRHTDCHD